MKRFFIFLALISLFSLTLLAQGINNLWLSGYQSWAGIPHGGTKMDFSSGNLVVSYENIPFNLNETNAVICDANGNLLFCSNGIGVFNAQYDTMMNGGGLNPGTWTSTRDSFGLSLPQANLVIPFPDDTNKYYLFHETIDDYGASYGSFYLYYSVIDMTLDNGLGVVIQKNVVLLNDTLVPGLLTACKHGNGRDWWITSHEFGSNRYYKYLISPVGIAGPFIQDIGSPRDIWSQCVFSPDGNWFAYYCPFLGDLDIYSFDRCTGVFSNPINIAFNDSANSGGVAFSPNSQLLYVSSMNYVYQFKLDTSNIPSTQTTVAVYDGYYSPAFPLATTFYLSALAPDGKIYINCGNSTLDIHVINYPDSIGLACDLQQHCIALPTYNAFTIPNHPNYFLGRLIGSTCDTLTGIRQLESEIRNIKVFPNPVSGNSFTASYLLPQNKKGVLEIFDAVGKKIYSENLPAWSTLHYINTLNFSSGLYIMRIISGGGSKSLKIVKE